MSIAKTISSGFETVLGLNPVQSLETPKTRAVVKSREKALQSWRDLVEESYKSKTEPESYVLERMAEDMGLDPNTAVDTFQADVKMFGDVHTTLSRKATVETRLDELYQRHGVTNDVGYAAMGRKRREDLDRQLKESQAEYRNYERDSAILMDKNVKIRRYQANTRLFPNGIVTTFKTTSEKE